MRVKIIVFIWYKIPSYLVFSKLWIVPKGKTGDHPDISIKVAAVLDGVPLRCTLRRLAVVPVISLRSGVCECDRPVCHR